MLMGSLASANDHDPYKRWLNAGDTWHSRWMNLADQSSSMSPDDKFKFLIGALGVAKKGKLTSEESEVYHRIQDILISTPGHAEYQKQIIENALKTLSSLPDHQKRSFLCGYRRTQAKVFQTLELLPSPETVRVLGDFLSDERGGLDYKEGDPIPTEDDFMCYQVQNCIPAATALRSLIDDPLSNRKPRSDQYHDWRLWYNQIKAGTRPIRFKGDPKEYHLENSARAEDAPLTTRPSKRPPPQSSEATGINSPTPSPTPWIIAAIASFSATIGWYFLK